MLAIYFSSEGYYGCIRCNIQQAAKKFLFSACRTPLQHIPFQFHTCFLRILLSLLKCDIIHTNDFCIPYVACLHDYHSSGQYTKILSHFSKMLVTWSNSNLIFASMITIITYATLTPKEKIGISLVLVHSYTIIFPTAVEKETSLHYSVCCPPRNKHFATNRGNSHHYVNNILYGSTSQK